MPQHPIPKFIAELKRRHVFRVVAAYAVVAWIITEVTATVAPALHLPQWVLTLVVVLAIAGFPIAAVLAWAYDITPDGVQRTPARDAALPPPSAPPAWRRAAALGTVVILIGVTGWIAWRVRAGAEPPPESDLVAVLPFRVSADPSLDYLREGMIDVLAAKLSGDIGPVTVDPRSLLIAWQNAGGSAGADLPLDGAIAVARGLGARQLLLGEVVSVPPRLTLSARLINTRDGSVAYRAAVDGPADSLPALVDQLAAQLLLVQAGEAEHRLESITTASLPALTSYLQGQSLFRSGRVEEALDRYLRALELDSMFVHAALGAWSAQVWGIQRPGVTERVQSIAFAGRHRLPERDQLHMLALSGPDWPAPSTAARRLDATQRAVSAAPDRPELWYHFGDVLTHDGARLGIADWRAQAIAAFERAGEAGLMTTEAIVHLLDLLIEAGDTARARQRGVAYLAQTEDGEVPQYLRWLLAASAAPAVPDADIAARLAPVSWRISRWIVQNGQLLGGGLERDAEHALRNLRAASQPQAERASSLRAEFGFLLNAGRPVEADRVSATLVTVLGPARAPLVDRWRIYAALYWDGVSDAATRAAAALERRRTPDGADADALGLHMMEQCALGQWRIAQGGLDALDETVRRLRTAAPPLDEDFVWHAHVCAVMLEALATESRGGDIAAAADRLEAAFDAQLPYFTFDLLFSAAPLVIARLREAHGDVAGALAWTRRRPGAGSTQHMLLSTHLREEGRLAALAGDRDSAIRAYMHYLALRAQPEPGTEADVERVRQALASLTTDAR